MNKAVIVLSSVLAFTLPVLAESGPSHSHQGQYGGIIADTGHHHMEIIVEDGHLKVYLTHDDGKPERVADAKASATILSEGRKEVVALLPDAANFLKGTGSFKASKGTTIVITLTMPGHQPEQARIKIE